MTVRIPNHLACLAFAAIAFVSSSAYSQAKKPATAAQIRVLTVVSQPETTVWINGVRFGKTDKDGRLTIKTVSSGPQTLRLRSDGFKEKSLPLTAAQKGEIKIDLVATTDEAELAFQEAERLTTSDREKAAAAYRKALQLRPAYPEASLGLTRVLLDSDKIEEAQQAIASTRKLRAGYAEASAVEGRIQKESGEEEKAAAAFKRAIAEGKGFQPEAYTGLGLLYKEKAEAAAGAGDFEAETAHYAEASKHLKLALKQLSGAPDAIVIYQLLGLNYERQKKNAEAIALYEEFLRLFPDTPEATAVQSFIVQLKKQ